MEMGVCVNKVFSLLTFFTFSFSAPGGGCCSSYVFAGSSSEETSGNAGIAAAQPEPGQVSELGFPGSLESLKKIINREKWSQSPRYRVQRGSFM